MTGAKKNEYKKDERLRIAGQERSTTARGLDTRHKTHDSHDLPAALAGFPLFLFISSDSRSPFLPSRSGELAPGGSHTVPGTFQEPQNLPGDLRRGCLRLRRGCGSVGRDAAGLRRVRRVCGCITGRWRVLSMEEI